ncbi:MAG TPA: MlaD family protein [Pirellulales bacterium]|jgi:phospholipid/cholesterol/gamma-HCH transport system substrate-binding protein|nr:MlaD family protein [Pirellulales bacterium]
MDERIMQFRVGVVVLAVALIAGFLTLLFGHLPASLLHRTYSIYIEFPQAPGVSVDTPLRKSGILIGRVTKVELIGEQQERVRVTVAVDQDYKILHSDTVRISASLLGDAELQVVPGADADKQDNFLAPTGQRDPRRGQFVPIADKADKQANAPVQPGETLHGTVANNPLQSMSNLEPEMSRAARALTTASDQVNKLATDIDKLLGTNNEQFDRLLNKTERSLDMLQKTMGSLDSIIGDPEANAKLRQSIAEMPTTLKQAQDALTSISRTSARAERNLENMEGFTKPLGERGETIINNADQSVRRLDELLGQMQQFSRQLNSREGSLGQLMYNPQLYQNLNEASTNINELSRQLKPILNDARAFSDKIARHPELLGVHGALQQSTGIK